MHTTDHPQVIMRRRPSGFDLKRFLLGLLLISSPVVLCATTLWTTHQEMTTARADYLRTEDEVGRLRMETERLKEEIHGLREDRQVIERIAREELHMLRPDELIISFPDVQQPVGQRRR